MDENTQDQLRIISAENRIAELEKSLLKLPELEARVNSLSKGQSTLGSEILAINSILKTTDDTLKLLNQVKQTILPHKSTWLSKLLKRK